MSREIFDGSKKSWRENFGFTFLLLSIKYFDFRVVIIDIVSVSINLNQNSYEMDKCHSFYLALF